LLFLATVFRPLSIDISFVNYDVSGNFRNWFHFRITDSVCESVLGFPKSLGFPKLIVDFVEPPTVKQAVDGIHRIGLLFDILVFGKKHLLGVGAGEFVDPSRVLGFERFVGFPDSLWETGLVYMFHRSVIRCLSSRGNR
jgi:hypothetical protein